jgi:hypothetical protein
MVLVGRTGDAVVDDGVTASRSAMTTWRAVKDGCDGPDDEQGQ